MAGTTSLKLPEELKERVAELARGVAQTPHAYMVEAIAERVALDERRRDFVDRAVQSREAFAKSGQAYRLEDVTAYYRAKLAGAEPRRPRPVKVKKPSR